MTGPKHTQAKQVSTHIDDTHCPYYVKFFILFPNTEHAFMLVAIIITAAQTLFSIPKEPRNPINLKRLGSMIFEI